MKLVALSTPDSGGASGSGDGVTSGDTTSGLELDLLLVLPQNVEGVVARVDGRHV